MRFSDERPALSPLRRGLLLAAFSSALTGCATQQQTSDPAIIGVQAWGGQAGMQPTTPQRISHLTLHHQGETWRIGDDVPAYLRRLQQWSRITKHWADIPYHYVVAPDGRIYAARPLGLPGDTNTEYDPSGHALVMLLGNFEDIEPTHEQLLATVDLMAWIARSQGLGADSIASHKDYSAHTVCPGKNLYRYLEGGWLKQAVARRLKGESLPAWPA